MKKRTWFYLPLALVFLLGSCASPEKLFEDGKYEKLISKYTKKGLKGDFSQRELGLFIDGFNSWSYDKEKELNGLANSTRYNHWRDGLKELKDINSIQSKVKAFPQVNEGDLRWLNLNDWDTQYKEKLYAHHLKEYNNLLARFEQEGKRRDVKEAYKEVDKLEQYAYRNIDESLEEMRQQCLELGHRNYNVLIENNASFRLQSFFPYFERELRFRSDKWNTFKVDNRNQTEAYELNIALVDISDKKDFADNHRTYTKEVLDYYQVETDTSGNRIETPVYKNVQAVVQEVQWNFGILSEANVLVIDNEKQTRIERETLAAEHADNVVLYYLVSGEVDAVPNNIRLERNRFYPNQYDFDELAANSLRDLARNVSNYVEDL